MKKMLQPELLARARILVRVPNWVGDAVLCLPALRLLQGLLPEAEIVLLARPWVRDIFRTGEPSFRVIPYDSHSDHNGIRGRLRIAALLREERYDAAILFQNAFDAALVACLSRIPIRAGYSRQGRGPLLTHRVSPPRKGEEPVHEVYYYLELLRRLGLVQQYSSVERITLLASEASRSGTRAQLLELLTQQFRAAGNRRKDSGLLIGINPGATFGTAKRWPALRFAELAARFHRERGAFCVFFGSPQEGPLAEEVITLAGVPAISLAGKTSLAEFIQLVQGCDLFVTNDSGTMHVAAGLGVPTLAIFGPTNEKETSPLAPRARVLTGEAFCRPCKLRHCPIDHRCMNSIGVERIFQAASAMLAVGSSREPEPLRSVSVPLAFQGGPA